MSYLSVVLWPIYETLCHPYMRHLLTYVWDNLWRIYETFRDLYTRHVMTYIHCDLGLLYKRLWTWAYIWDIVNLGLYMRHFYELYIRHFVTYGRNICWPISEIFDNVYSINMVTCKSLLLGMCIADVFWALFRMLGDLDLYVHNLVTYILDIQWPIY